MFTVLTGKKGACVCMMCVDVALFGHRQSAGTRVTPAYIIGEDSWALAKTYRIALARLLIPNGLDRVERNISWISLAAQQGRKYGHGLMYFTIPPFQHTAQHESRAKTILFLLV